MRTISRITALGLALVITLLASACGDDGGSSATGEDPGSTSAVESTPVVGGEATILQWTESTSMDAARAVGSSGTDAIRMFAVYGALVAADSETGEVERLFAESLESDATAKTWTLTLRPGLTFSDGATFDAAAVKLNWERIKDPAVGSPAIGAAAQISRMVVTDPQTLTIELTQPNGQFDRTISRNALNYIASPDAISSGRDLASEPVGAGPFLLEQWLRDDRMVLVKNPTYFDAPRPYLDKLTIRVLGSADQRVDTFKTGGADGFYTNAETDVQRTANEGAFIGSHPNAPMTLMFNVTTSPFDDARLRRAIAMGFDRRALIDVTVPGGTGATNMTAEGSPWFAPDAELPKHNIEEAQALIDEIVSERGAPLELTLLTTTSPLGTAQAKFIQTALNQLDGLTVEVEALDSPTFVPRVIKGDFSMTVWGLPWTDPEPLLYANLRGGLPSNLMRYDNPVVNDGLDEARAAATDNERAEHYQAVFEQLAEDLPFIPWAHGIAGYVISPQLQGGRAYEDGAIRVDLLWRTG